MEVPPRVWATVTTGLQSSCDDIPVVQLICFTGLEDVAVEELEEAFGGSAATQCEYKRSQGKVLFKIPDYDVSFLSCLSSPTCLNKKQDATIRQLSSGLHAVEHLYAFVGSVDVGSLPSTEGEALEGIPFMFPKEHWDRAFK